ncbi:flagella synthesis protein FlgN [Ketobacter sp.]|uniref:flagella synthesis protein FlgN n=1 Tax=Ketobacter sp. TaxID=2083498 RepID=UPI000F25B20F|nr:flagellar protein FlgN [Ketobacter sp.]RLT92593.1 MAG: flagellar protein FlgN [Ketobacter sp.]
MTNQVSPQAAQQLLRAIEKDYALAQTLKTVLQEEKSILEQRQYAAHSALLSRKTQLLMELDQADHARRQAMADMGLQLDKQGFDLFVQQVPPTWQARFQSGWEKLADTMNACARLNRVNGKILAHAQNSMEHLMSIIKGTANQVSVYQANGRRNLNAAHRMLATA